MTKYIDIANERSCLICNKGILQLHKRMALFFSLDTQAMSFVHAYFDQRVLFGLLWETGKGIGLWAWFSEAIPITWLEIQELQIVSIGIKNTS